MQLPLHCEVVIVFLFRFLFSRQFNDETVQLFGQTLAVIVAFLGEHVDGLQGGTVSESFLINLVDAGRKRYRFDE